MSTASQETPLNDALDIRQRNMLQAMGITLWRPEPVTIALPVAASSPLTISSPTNEKIQPNQYSAPSEYVTIATKNIAPSTVSAQRAAPLVNVTQAVSSPHVAPRPSGIEHMAWPELQSTVASCQACGLCQSRKKTVFGVGQTSMDDSQAPQADWLIVGEAPGEQEDLAGEPFVGPAGKLLDNMLAAMKHSLQLQGKPLDLSRSQGSYIVNVLKCRPPANRNPSPEEVAICEPYLARQIELLRPKIILAMGKFAISSLTGSTEAVGKLRGRVHALKHASYQVPVIVTYHPAYLLRNMPDKAKAWADLMLAMQTYLALSSEA